MTASTLNEKLTTTTQHGSKLYKSDTTLPTGGGEWIMDPTNLDETRKMLGRSFGGTEDVDGEPIFEWIYNHISNESFTIEERQKLTTFVITFPLFAATKSKTKSLIVSKRVDGNIASTAIIVERNKNNKQSFGAKFIESWRMFKAFVFMMRRDTLPDIFTKKEWKKEMTHFEKKGKEVQRYFDKWHEEDAPNDDLHWYMQTVGVAPEYNGKGFGRELIEKVNSLADQVGISCYLECGVTKKGFYEKMGYKVVSFRTMEDPVDKSRAPLEAYTMIRKPRTLL